MKTLAGPQSGAQGDMVASRNRSGQFLRKRVSPRNPRTTAQRRARENMRTFSRLWNQLTEAQRVAWCAAATNVLSRPKLGKSRPLDGQKFFNKINTVLAICGREPLLDPPPRVRPESGCRPYGHQWTRGDCPEAQPERSSQGGYHGVRLAALQRRQIVLQ
jgi:hypothetical protein